jgi:hypothetical protein
MPPPKAGQNKPMTLLLRHLHQTGSLMFPTRTNSGRTFLDTAPEPCQSTLRRAYFLWHINCINGVGSDNEAPLFRNQASNKENYHGLLNAFGICNKNGGRR